MLLKEIDGEVQNGQRDPADGSDSLGPLDDGFMPLDTQLEFAQAAGLSVAEEFFHLRFEDGKIGEDLGFEIGHR